MIRVRIPVLIAAVGLALTACGGSDSGSGGGGGGTSAPAAPELVAVMPMAGVLHVEWTTTTTCDYIDAERKDVNHPAYAAAWEVSGEQTNHMDGDASEDLTYSYRLRCKVGDELSDYSNEMSGNPTATSP